MGHFNVSLQNYFSGKKTVSKRNNGRKIDLDEDRAPKDNVEPELEPEQSVQDNVNDNTAQETQIIRRYGRPRHELERYYGFLLIDNGDLMLIDQDDPQTYQDAMNSSDTERWLEAMKSELESMYANQVWTLVNPPEEVKPIG